ncbi:MAG: LysM peptidoglycan-binding domain-containing protein [Luteolibacter sp.]
MKFQTLPVKRRPVSKGILHRFHAVTTRGRRQRVAAAGTAPEIEEEYDGARISRSLTIIFLIHIVAIALIFIHQQFLQGRESGSASSSGNKAATTTADAPRRIAPRRSGEPPRLSSGEKPYIVRAGDNYARIAAAEEVDEGDLRDINNHAEISPGLILKIPPRRIVAEEPPELAAIRESNSQASGRGQVVDVSDAPRAVMVRPVAAPPRATPVSRRHHVVKPGESIYGLSKQYEVSQQALMEANGISDPLKLRAGARLTIPAH